MTSTISMKRLVLFALIVFAMGSHATVSAAPVPEETDFLGNEVVPEPPRPVRKIDKLPGSVSYKKLGNKRHQYQVTGLYPDPGGKDLSDDGGVSVVVPDCVEAHLDRKKLTCTFITSRKLSFSDLAYALDDLARGGGEFPYWVELEARDLAASEERKFVHYTVVESKEELPKELAWFGIPEGGLRLPIAYAGDGLGTLLVTQATASCMCHIRYCIRILDCGGKVIWKDDETASGSIQFALSDPRGSKIDVTTMHRIWLIREDVWHKKDTFVISGSLQAPAKNAEDQSKPAEKAVD